MARNMYTIHSVTIIYCKQCFVVILVLCYSHYKHYTGHLTIIVVINLRIGVFIFAGVVFFSFSFFSLSVCLCLPVCLSLTVCLSVCLSVRRIVSGWVDHGARTSRFNFGSDPIVITERKPWGGGLHSLGAMSSYI